VTLIETMTRDDLTGPEFTDRYTEDEQHGADSVLQAHRCEEGGDVGVQHVVRHHVEEGDNDDRKHAGDADDPADRRALALGLSGEIGHGREHPDDHEHGEQSHHAATSSASRPGRR
jgi:hypothetical protein